MADKLFKTENLRLIFGVLDFCYTDKTLGILLGKSGAGKTTGIRAWMVGKKDIIYLQIGDDSYNRKDVLFELSEKIGVVTVSRSLQELKRQIIESVVNKRIKILIIDQANFLPVSIFNVLTYISETANVGLVLAGTHKLGSTLTRGDRNLELDQFSSRVKHKTFADKILDADLVQFLEAENVEKAKDFDMLITQLSIRAKSTGQFRAVVNILESAKRHWKLSKSTQFLPEYVFRAMEYII
jgi:DNA transposition AAA+ family ATPase